MLPGRKRLPKSFFAAPPTQMRRVTTAHFSVQISEYPPQGGCAVVISKKIGRLSVTRHLVKRRVYDVLAPYCSLSKALVVYARSGSASLPSREIRNELAPVLERLFPVSGTV